MTWALAVSGDGRWLATSDWSGLIQLWDLEADRAAAAPLRSVRVEEGISCLALDHTGSRVVVGDNEGGIHLWDVSMRPEGAPVTLRERGNLLEWVRFSGEDTILAASWDEVVEWRLEPTVERLQVVRRSEEPGERLVRSFGSQEAGRIVFRYADGRLRVFDRGAGGRFEELAATTLTQPHRPSEIDALSPDGQWLLLAGQDVTLWHVEGDAPRRYLGKVHGHVTSAAFDSADTRLAIGTTDGRTLVWELERPEAEPITLVGHRGWVLALAFGPRGRWLATGSNDRTARLWDLNPATHTTRGRVFRGHDSGITGFAFSPDGRWLAAGTADHAPRLWDLTHPSGPTEPRVLNDGTHVLAAHFLHDSRWLATGDRHGRVRLWSLEGERPHEGPVLFPGLGDAVLDFTTSPDGRWLAAETAGPLLLWELDGEGGAGRAELLPGVMDHAFAPGGRWLITGRFWGAVEAYDLAAEEIRASRRVLHVYESRVAALLPSPDGRFLITGDGRDHHLWRIEDGELRPEVLDLPEDAPGLGSGSAFGPEGRWIGASCRQAELCLYRFDGRARLENPIPLRGHDSPVVTMVFTSDSRWVITGSNDQTARLWALEGAEPGRASAVLRGHESQLLRIATSPDGRWLATTALDAVPRLWDLSVSEPASTGAALPLHGLAPFLSEDALFGESGSKLRGLYDVAFSRDSRYLATVSLAGEVFVWTLDVDAVIGRACRAAGRNLTLVEWQRFVPLQAPYACTCPSLPPGVGGPNRCPERGRARATRFGSGWSWDVLP